MILISREEAERYEMALKDLDRAKENQLLAERNMRRAETRQEQAEARLAIAREALEGVRRVRERVVQQRLDWAKTLGNDEEAVIFPDPLEEMDGIAREALRRMGEA